MSRKTVLIIPIVMLVLSACAQTNDQECRSYGARPGTDAYVQCMSSLANRDAIDDANMQAGIRSLSKPTYHPTVCVAGTVC
jgi:hypothetical protein